VIRAATLEDSKAISEIYNYFITDSVITFEEQTITASDIEQRLKATYLDKLPWLVKLDEQNTVVGYAYANKWRERSAYRYTVEATVYLSSHVQGQGLGSQLYQALFEQLKQLSIQEVVGGITLPNEQSIALHEKFGMKKVAHFEKVGLKFNQWHDVGFWQVNIQ
jgi:phosphinothricin acetyltransferase